MAKEYVKREKEGVDMLELEKFTLGSLRRAVFEGDVDTGSLMAGQVAGMINEIKPIKIIIKELFDDCATEFKKLGEIIILFKPFLLNYCFNCKCFHNINWYIMLM